MPFKITANGRVAIFADEQSMEDALNGGIVLPPLSGFLAKGAKFNIVGIDGSLRSLEATDAIARYTGLTEDEANFIAAFVDAEVANGNWGTNAANYTDSLYDCFFCFGLVTEANALTDMHQVLKLTATNNGATKVSDGFSFAGAEHILPNYTPSTGINFAQNDAQISLFIATKNTIAFGVYTGARNAPSSGGNLILQSNTGGTIDEAFFAINGTAATPRASAFSDNSLFNMVRENSADHQLFKDGSQIGTITTPSIPATTTPVAIGANNDNGTIGTFSDGTYSSFMAGAAIGFDQTGFNTNIVTLLTSLGVLP